jgi:Amt family ammonium transporter
VGWYGFNAGSALGADGIAANAFTATTLAAAVGSFAWGLLERILRGRASILGFCSGAVAGLVVITPACGFVTPGGAVAIGVLAAVVPYFFVNVLKARFGYDDALDTFGVHAVGGTVGAILTGFFASASVNPNLTAANPAAVQNGLAQRVVTGGLWVEQLKAVGLTLGLALAATLVLAFLVKALVGLRLSVDLERQGLDLIEHGEEGYID